MNCIEFQNSAARPDYFSVRENLKSFGDWERCEFPSRLRYPCRIRCPKIHYCHRQWRIDYHRTIFFPNFHLLQCFDKQLRQQSPHYYYKESPHHRYKPAGLNYWYKENPALNFHYNPYGLLKRNFLPRLLKRRRNLKQDFPLRWLLEKFFF